MNIKNYTSTVPAATSMSRIEHKLVEIGASNINKEYEDRVCVAINFLYTEPGKDTLVFRIQPKVQECFDVLWADVKKPRADTEKNTMEQANRTAWKIISDWIDIQCTMILLDQAKPLQMFLPYVYDPASGQTLFDRIEKNPKLLSA